MRIGFSQKAIDEAPASHVRIAITEDTLSRVVREAGHETLEIGVGKWSEVTKRKFLLLCREIVQQAKKNRVKKIALQLDGSPFPLLAPLPLPELGRLIAENLVMANFEFLKFKSPSPENNAPIEEVLICGNTPREMRDGFILGETVGKAVNACRELANTPGADMTPQKLVEAAKQASKGLPIKVRVLDTKAMKKERMGAVLAVGKGSSEKPAFIALEYQGSKASPIVLVGKGVTFDSGGLNIKTEGHMYEMHMDMSGGAAAILTLVLAAKLKLKKHVVALVPAVENMSASNAVRPGDIITSLSGKTIEVVDTDAEGRLILADALTYAKRYKPAVVIDAATLTGASLSALGTRASALLTKDEALAKLLLELGEVSGDYLWRLPLWEEYEENMKGTFADLVNLPVSTESHKGDAINAAAFLFAFAKELNCPWAHLDIAPRMTSNASDKLAKGAAGAPVRLLIRFIETWNS
jgi:leucyl aminopeptidase